MCRDSKLLVDTGFTLRHPDFAPRGFYREHADGVFTPICFPYIDDLPQLPGHTITAEIEKYRAPLLVNRHAGDRSIAPIEPNDNKLTRSYLKKLGRPTKMLTVRIRPEGWSWRPPGGMQAATKDELFQVYAKMLCDEGDTGVGPRSL
jgi:hypothetical protein